VKLHISNKIGKTGEDIVCGHLRRNGFSIEDRNYLERSGEIDIIAKKGDTIHFFEVKSVSCENLMQLPHYDPMEKVDDRKRSRMARTIESYLIKRKLLSENIPWQVNIAAVFIDSAGHKASIKILNAVTL
jgi:putative endonuclease